jgi:hypothetical protein
VLKTANEQQPQWTRTIPSLYEHKETGCRVSNDNISGPPQEYRNSSESHLNAYQNECFRYFISEGGSKGKAEQCHLLQ